MSGLVWFIAGSLASQALWAVFVVARVAAADREDKRRIAKEMETRQ